MTEPKIARAASDPKITHSMSKLVFGREHMQLKKRTQPFRPMQAIKLFVEMSGHKYEKTFQLFMHDFLLISEN